MEMWEILLLAGYSRDMETMEEVLSVMNFIEEDHGHSEVNLKAEATPLGNVDEGVVGV